MSWSRFLLLLLLCEPVFAGEGYIVGGGIESDNADGLAGSLIGEFGLTEKTWLSAAAARNTVDRPDSTGIDSWYADVGIDHWFEPFGVRAGLSYWGDQDTLDSTDYRGSIYWRNDRFSVAANYEFRDFEIDLLASDFGPARTVGFDADGIGLTARVEITDDVDFGVSGMDYDYSVNLRLDDNRRLLELLAFSRLSLINSLVDYRAYATLGVDVGERRWELDVGRWRGEVDGGKTTSATLRYLNPVGESADIEFALGYDDSDLYGGVTFFSVFLFFYGG